MIESKDEAALEQFFSAFSEAINKAALEELAVFYHVPCVFVSNDEKSVCSSTDQIIKRVGVLLDVCQKVDAIKHSATIVHSMSLSDRVLFAKVDWQIRNSQDELCLTCATSYTLERGGAHGFDIIVSVIAEEEQALGDMCSKMGA